MKIVVIGAGSIGASIAIVLKNQNYDVSFVVRSEKTRELINSQGFKLTGAKGSFSEKVPTFLLSDLNDTDKFDICIIATKYMQMRECAQNILPFLNETSLVVGMQNGICNDELAEVVGKDRTVGCMIGFGATKKADNHVEMTSLGKFYIGMICEKTSQNSQNFKNLEDLQEILSHFLPTEISQDIKLEQYSKLIINSCINAVSALTGKTLGEVLDDKRARNLFLKIAREAMSVAKAMEIKVPKYGALLDYRLITLADFGIYNSLCKSIFWLVGKLKYANVKPSTLQSLERGEKTEIDIFNGYFSQKGKEFSCDTPINNKIVSMIKQIENHEREISMENLDEF